MFFYIVLCIVMYLCKMTEYITIRLSKENIYLSIIKYTEFKMLLVIHVCLYRRVMMLTFHFPSKEREHTGVIIHDMFVCDLTRTYL